MSQTVEKDGELKQVLDEDGRVLADATVPDLSEETLVEMYAQIRLCRQFDERAVSLQRQGRSGTYSTMLGHEGALIGSAFAMADNDWIVPYYRDQGATVTHGLDLANILLYYMGHEQGSVIPKSTNVMPISITIGAHLPHATGIGMAAKYKGDDVCVTCYFGDGATSEGDFHEALNFAGVFDTPNLFFCLNNQWAISTAFKQQTAANTIAQKATAYGFDSVRVDGMDPLAVYQVTENALKKAKDPDEGELRPTLVEALLYRLGAHNTSDDPSSYRDEEASADWRKKDPLPRMELFLRERGLIDDDRIDALDEEIEMKVENAVETAESYEPNLDEMFEHAYEEPTPRLRKQQEWLRSLRDRYGDGALLED